MSASVIETQNITIPTWMRYHYKLQSESSDASDISSGPESTHSIQNRETDLEKNTTDTSSASEYEVEIEYEINGSDDNEGGNFSSASSNHQGAQDFVIAALAVCDASLEVWLTGSEDSSDPDAEDKANISGYRTCLNCKSQNDSPHKITYCEKCYQVVISFKYADDLHEFTGYKDMHRFWNKRSNSFTKFCWLCWNLSVKFI